MSFLLSGPILFIDDDELLDCIELFSECIRSDAAIRPTLDRLLGNRWADAERQAHGLFHATLFGDARPRVDANFLARAVRVLKPDDVDRLADTLLSCILQTFPVNSAGDVCEVATELASTLKTVIAAEGLERQRQLLKTLARLNAGALLSRL